MLYLQSGANLQSLDAVLAKCKPLATERVRVDGFPQQHTGEVTQLTGMGSGAYLIRNGDVIGQRGLQSAGKLIKRTWLQTSGETVE